MSDGSGIKKTANFDTVPKVGTLVSWRNEYPSERRFGTVAGLKPGIVRVSRAGKIIELSRDQITIESE